MRQPHPSAEPAYTTTVKIVSGPIRDSTGHRSAMLAATMVTPGLPATPTRKRQRQSTARLRAKPAPRMNRAITGTLMRYTGFRPKVSLHGPEMTGPKAKPRINSEYGTSAAVEEMPNSCMTALCPAA